MAIRPKPLFGTEHTEMKRQSERELIGTGGVIDQLCKIVDLKPHIKIIKHFPDAGEMEAIESENVYDGILILFDALRSDATDLKEIIQLRPLLLFSNGHIPAREKISSISDDRSYDGYLITFKRLTPKERDYVYGKKQR